MTLLPAYVADTSLMVRLHRTATVTGAEFPVELPKIFLEMVRCLVAWEAEVPMPDDALSAALWADLHAAERQSPGPALDQMTERVWRRWDPWAARVLSAGVEPAGEALHTHPHAVLPYLFKGMPCSGLTSAAAVAFRHSLRITGRERPRRSPAAGSGGARIRSAD